MNTAKLLSKNLIQNGIVSRFYYTNRVNQATLHSRITPLKSERVEAELEDWLKNGNKISFAEFQRIVHFLRKRLRFPQALKVSEWMNKKGICTFSPTEHAVQLDLIGRVRGILSAEIYFHNLKDQDKTDKTYGALLNCYVRKRQTDKFFSHLQKMKELGFASSALTYNDIMWLYTKIGQHEKVPDVMREMKENKISPDNFSYRLCIISYGERSDLEGMERILIEMESQPHIKMDWNTYAVVGNFYIKAGRTEKAIDALKKSEQKLGKKGGTGYNQLISLYASLGNKAEVLRLWGLEKDACKRCTKRDFIIMLRSLVKLDEFEEAEKIIKEWESSGNYYDFQIPKIVIIGYAEKGLHEKAEAMLEDLKGKGQHTIADTWVVVAKGYLDKGQVRKAFECVKSSLSLTMESNGWRPNLRVVTPILDWLGDEGSLQEVEDFVASLRTVMPVHRRMVNKATLYSRISPLGSLKSVEPELEDWLKNGNKISFAEFQRIVRDLRKRRRFTQALEVSEWMNKKALCAFSPTEHAVQLDLIGRVRGFVSAESYFDNLKDQDKTEKTYGALLNCYVRQRQTDKSLSHLQKMKELGFASSPLTYNDIMCLYTNIGQHEKVPDVMREMKEKKISPDNFSYRICINSYGVKSDLEGMERILMEMESQPDIKMDWNTYAVAANFYIKAGLTEKAIDALKKSEPKLDKKDGTGYNQLISLYASLGNKAEVLRLWGLEKDACKRCINKDFITILQSLVKLDEFEEAEKIIKEWESSGNYYDFRVPNIVIIGYAEKGLHEKAEAMLEDLIGKGKGTTPNSWGVVATCYLDKGQVRKAFECMKAALSLTAVSKVWRPNLRVVTSILDWLGDEGSLQEVEDFVASLRTVMPVHRRMYVALLKANVRNGNGVDELLKLMKADKIDEDKETKAILSMKSC
ncbi:hypothetical protein CCACVL1_15659 [Corchorus capsularis]|uniref:Pentacotripeptide-repeat region of PRORP domain-containing protein n=1 Tax=Corchorus capsularis TaxID=210143 RepID=A0A1R3I1J4_COCAP|nr:hypothetical protein CCACVL1_15659 [Corchorus capsularis]